MTSLWSADYSVAGNTITAKGSRGTPPSGPVSIRDLGLLRRVGGELVCKPRHVGVTRAISVPVTPT